MHIFEIKIIPLYNLHICILYIEINRIQELQGADPPLIALDYEALLAPDYLLIAHLLFTITIYN